MDPPESRWESAEGASALLDFTQDKIVVVDAEGNYRYANAATERILGYERDAFVGTNTFEYIHPEDEAAVRVVFEGLVDAAEERTETIQFRHRAVDGSWVWLESRMWNRTDSDLDGYVVSSRDVTARKSAESREREIEARLAELAANTNDVLWMFSADWDELLFVNEAFEDIWNIPRSELEADPSRFFDAVHPDDREALEESMAQLSAGDPVDSEYRLGGERSCQRWIWVQGQPIIENGTVTRVVGFARDITDRRRRTRQLRVLDNLLRHNLRNVMNVVIGHAELAKRSEETDTETAMETIIEAGEGLLRTIEKERRIVNVLVDSGEPVEIDLSAVLSELFADMRTLDPDAGITTNVPDELKAAALPEIRDAIAEILENAIVHSSCPPEIAVRVETCAESVSIEIADNGPPIPGNEFEPLFSERRGSNVYHGTGLGLWLVYWTVDRSGGELEFGRAPGGGNSVRIRLPRPA